MTSHHEPELFRSRRYGCWATCTCGLWQSRQWTTVSGAHWDFGRHLIEENHAER